MGEVHSIKKTGKKANVRRLVSYSDRQSLRKLLVLDKRPVMFAANPDLCFHELETMSRQRSFAKFGHLMNSGQVLSVGTPGNIPAKYGDRFQFMAGSQFVFVKAVQD